MRSIVLFTLSTALVVGAFDWSQLPAVARQRDDKPLAAKLTPAAELTLSKALKAKMTVNFTDARLGDVLKEFAAQVDQRADLTLLWAYGKDFPYAQKVSYSCKDKPLDAALDELFKKLGPLGYVVVSKEGDRRDGWVMLTVTGERGVEKEPLPPATAEEEADAEKLLMLAKKLIDGGTSDKAKTVLAYIVKKHPSAKATAEAKELLMKLEK